MAQDGITGDILASKHIFQETVEDYKELLRAMMNTGYPRPHFAVIDGRNGIERIIQSFYSIPVQMCQAHKIATVDRYLLKYPRRESYRKLKHITHEMVLTDKLTFIWMLKEFRVKYMNDFEAKTLNPKTLRYHATHPRLHQAFKSLLRDIDRLFICHDFLQTI